MSSVGRQSGAANTGPIGTRKMSGGEAGFAAAKLLIGTRKMSGGEAGFAAAKLLMRECVKQVAIGAFIVWWNAAHMEV